MSYNYKQWAGSSGRSDLQKFSLYISVRLVKLYMSNASHLEKILNTWPQESNFVGLDCLNTLWIRPSNL